MKAPQPPTGPGPSRPDVQPGPAEAPNLELHDKLAALQSENAYLRELVASLKSLGSDQLKLLQQIGDLEQQVAVLKGRRGQQPPADQDAELPARTILAGAVQPRDSARRSGIRATVLATAAKIRPAEPDRKRVLIVGPPSFQRESWRLFGHSELTDLIYGLSDTAAVRFVGGPLPPACMADFAPLERRYDAQAVDFRGLGAIDETVWAEVIDAAVEQFEPDLVLVLDTSSVALKAVPRLRTRAGTRTVLICSRGRLADVDGDALAGEDDLVSAASRADLVLATSNFEKRLLSRRTGSDGKVQLYLRGVDLTRFKPAGVSAPDRVVFVDDRAGPAGLQCFRDAAGQRMIKAALRLELFSTQPASGDGFTGRPLPGRNERQSLYLPGTVVVVPAECSGYSQVMMEGLASGCVCLVPSTAFPAQENAAGAWMTYAPTADGLVASLNELTQARDRGQRLQSAAFEFSRASLARSVWGSRLREAVLG